MTAVECPDCGTPVLVTGLLVLDARRTTSGPYKRDGSPRSKADIYISTTYGHRDGYAVHHCDSIRGTA